MDSNLYLITGDENFEKQECLEKIKSDFGELVKGINFIILEKDSINNLENEINTYPFGFDKKLIIVKFEKKEKADKVENEQMEEKSDWLTDNLEKELSNLKDNCVVFYGDFQKKSRIFKLVDKYGKCLVCEKKKEYELLTWSTKIFKDKDVQISSADLNYLINLVGTDKLTLKNEIDKLVSYAMQSKIITKESIDLLCIKTSDVIIFDLTDNLGSKNVKVALKCLNDLIENKEPIQKITIMIAKHFKSLLIAKMASMENKDVMAELGTKSTYAANKYISQARSFKLEEITKIIKELAKLDIDSKVGLIDLKIGLEKVICG